MTTLEAYRLKAGQLLIAFLVLNAVVLAAVATARHLRNALTLDVAGFVLAAIAIMVWRRDRTGFRTRLVSTLAGVGFAALFLELASGTEIIIDMHMYFFAVLAICAGLCCIPSLVAAAAFVALHHLILNYLYPTAVFPQASSLARVLLHALVVAVEVGALSLVIRRLVSSFESCDAAVAANAEARAAALHMAEQQSSIADREARARKDLVDMFARFRGSVVAPLDSIRDSGASMRATSELLLGAAAVSADAVAEADAASSLSADGAQSVSGSTHELAASIAEIGHRMTTTARIVEAGASQSAEMSGRIASLTDGIERVEQLVGIIQKIAQQTNMLALNATIEAARAGDYGRGFAVVASEVKGLATETEKAVREIEISVGDIKTIGDEAVLTVGHIASVMARVNTDAFEITEAVRSQQIVTGDIAETVVKFADQISRLSRQVEVASRSAEDTRVSASAVERASVAVTAAGARLATEIDAFMATAAPEVSTSALVRQMESFGR